MTRHRGARALAFILAVTGLVAAGGSVASAHHSESRCGGYVSVIDTPQGVTADIFRVQDGPDALVYDNVGNGEYAVPPGQYHIVWTDEVNDFQTVAACPGPTPSPTPKPTVKPVTGSIQGPCEDPMYRAKVRNPKSHAIIAVFSWVSFRTGKLVQTTLHVPAHSAVTTRYKHVLEFTKMTLRYQTKVLAHERSAKGGWYGKCPK